LLPERPGHSVTSAAFSADPTSTSEFGLAICAAQKRKNLLRYYEGALRVAANGNRPERCHQSAHQSCCRSERRHAMTTTDTDKNVGHGRVTRTGFVRGAAVSLLALSAGGAATLSSSRARAAPPKGTVTRYPLHLPPSTSPAGLTLSEAPAVVDLGGGKYSNVLAYNGFFPGPSIVARRGDAASVHLVNGLSEPTITHWHGMVVEERNDGGPKYAIAPGASYDYAFTINQRACLNWYHPHPHMLTGEQVNLGLAGAFIVRDSDEDAFGLPYGAHEVPLIIRDADLDTAGNLAYKPRTGGFDGQISLVNGTLSPYLAVDQGLYRFRVLNGANARIFGLALSNGAPFALIGNDGGFLETQSNLSRIDLAPAERLDLLLSFSGLPVGQSVMLRDLRAGWDLLEFRSSPPAQGLCPR
jgi:FtsP/CotA-like multicopper oxidase with cupredoxin domain